MKYSCPAPGCRALGRSLWEAAWKSQQAVGSTVPPEGAALHCPCPELRSWTPSRRGDTCEPVRRHFFLPGAETGTSAGPWGRSPDALDTAFPEAAPAVSERTAEDRAPWGVAMCSGPSCPTVRGVGSPGSGNQSGALCSPESASPSSQQACALRVAGPRPLWRFTWWCDCRAPGGAWHWRRHRGVRQAPIIRRRHPHTRPVERRSEGPLPKPSASHGRRGRSNTRPA